MNRFVQRVCLLGVAVLLLSACTFGAPATLPQTATATAPPPSAATLQEAEDAPALPATLPNGIAAGDVDQTSVVLWARSTATGPITFTLSLAEGEGIEPQTRASRVLDPSIPLTVSVTGLTPGSPYVYRVSDSAGGQMTGRFRTAADDKRTGLRFGASGDWRGDLAPYPAMTNIPESDLDFFVALGDTIYADIGSPAVPSQTASLDDFRRKFAEVYASHASSNLWARVRASTALFVTIDDHEVLNNFSGGAEAGRDGRFPESEGLINDTALYENALQALHEYHPLAQEFYADEGDERFAGERRLYRYRRFGLDAALLVLDARSFRDLPIARPDRDDPADVARFWSQTFRPGRTMLGARQLADLKRDLLAAHRAGVTWIFIAIPEPAQNRGLISAQDRFEGYAAERADLLRFLDDNGICNVVFVAADIHGSLVNNLLYRTSADGVDRAIHAFEISVGPVAFDPPLGPVVWQHGQDEGYVTPEEAAAYLELPVANDSDSTVDDRDDWVKQQIDEELVARGYDPLGLDDSPLKASLEVGDYVAVEYFGWTEFEIGAEDQQLTITTFGIEPYGRGQVSSDAQSLLDRTPQIVSRFRVAPESCRP